MVNLKKKKLFAKGHRSIIYTAFLDNKKVCIKVARKDISIKKHILNEAKFLEILNKKDIGPKLLYSGKDFIVYEFVDGENILDWIKKANKKTIKKVLGKIFEKCYVMDSLGIEKKEMHHPVKHILIGRHVKMIDFERCRKTKKPKNVTQFCQFLMSKEVSNLLSKKDFKKVDKKALMPILRSYKKKINKKDFRNIVNFLYN